MHYHVSRNGQTYGPYTLEDLQRYLASGNILPTDLAKTDEMTEWIPVSQILASQAAPGQAAPGQAAATPAFSTPGLASPGFTNPGYADPAYSPAAQPNPALLASQYPDAPNLHWGLVLLFSFITCFIFTPIWQVVTAAWLKRVQPNATALIWYIAAIVLLVIRWIVTIMIVGSVFRHGIPSGDHLDLSAGFFGLAALSKLLGLGALVTIITGNFMMRSSLEEHFNGPEPVGLRLSGVMTFFFAPWYFQYHLNKINALKQAARYNAPRAY